MSRMVFCNPSRNFPNACRLSLWADSNLENALLSSSLIVISVSLSSKLLMYSSPSLPMILRVIALMTMGPQFFTKLLVKPFIFLTVRVFNPLVVRLFASDNCWSMDAMKASNGSSVKSVSHALK